ncbi:unnamed protein product [Peronospora farinosa]|uniref:AMP-dependent synthetase/ligase domain-containing protein n=1 Tax=Peronospora farinosa TaxID=134698 RepID=A0AAV0UQZ2_9STRA|nr:unnamed protein product [Peronospora farinosa]
MLRRLSRSGHFDVRHLRIPSRREIASYTKQYRRSLDKPEELWAEAAHDIEWFKPWSKVLDTTNGSLSRRFVGGEMNTCYNALDVHVNSGRGNVVALRYDCPLTNTKPTMTYSQLLEEISVFAGGLQKLGVKKSDRVMIYMPVVLETTVAMLACARLEAVHSVVFGGFATLELAARIIDATPKLIISPSCGVEPKGIIDYVLVLAENPLYILYTSGTTGRPKGVVQDNGGYAVALKRAMRISSTSPKTIHSLRTFVLVWLKRIGTLLTRCSCLWSVLYAGKPVGTPNAGAYWRLVTEYDIKSMFTAPTALRAIRKEDSNGLPLKAKKDEIRKTRETMFVAGECGDPKTLNFFQRSLVYLLSTTGGKQKLDGLSLRQKDAELVVKLPLPPGALISLHQKPDDFCAKYFKRFPGYYHTGDIGHIDEEGFVYVCCCVISICVLFDRKKRSSSKWRDVRGEMGSFVWLKDVGMVDALPKTRSDKVMRTTIKAVADSDPFCVPATIDNAAVLDDIHVELQKLGYVKTKSIVTGK